MGEITTRLLGEEDWQTYRELRLAALKDSPDAFVADYEDEAEYDEAFWRERMRRAYRLVAEDDGEMVGVVGLGRHEEDDEAGEIFGLWVAPGARGSRVAWRLVTACAQQAYRDGRKRVYFWVDADNGPAVAFASNFGFRPTAERRPIRKRGEPAPPRAADPAAEADDADQDFTERPAVDEEVAMVLPLTSDPGAGINAMLG